MRNGMMKTTTTTKIKEEEQDEEEEKEQKVEVCALRMCGKALDREHRAMVRVRCAEAGALAGEAATVVAWDAAGGAVLHRECWDVATAALPRAASGARTALIGGPRLRLRVGSAERGALTAADRTAEHFDAGVVVRDKARAAAALLARAHRCVVFTGAGVSTAAGIRDFRGPEGRWTLAPHEGCKRPRSESPDGDRGHGGGSNPRLLSVREMNRGTAGLLGGERVPRGRDCVARAVPTAAHRVVADLVARGRVTLIVTQNVDGLHQAAGVPRDQVVELHGNAFTEFCPVSFFFLLCSNTCSLWITSPLLSFPFLCSTITSTTEMRCHVREKIRCESCEPFVHG